MNEIDRFEAIQSGLDYLHGRMATALLARFRELAQYIEWRVQYSDYWDQPFRIQIGEVEGQCPEFYGYDPHLAMQDFLNRGVPMCENRLRCG